MSSNPGSLLLLPTLSANFAGMLCLRAGKLMHQMNMMTGGIDVFGLGGVPGATTFSFQAASIPFPGMFVHMAHTSSGLNSQKKPG
jgi:hypothetical protein